MKGLRFSVDENPKANEKILKIKTEANKILEKRLARMRESFKQSELRLEQQKDMLKKKLALQKQRNEMITKVHSENIDRQKRKESFKKLELKKSQEMQNKKMEEAKEVKESLLLQSGYVKISNQLRKFYLTKEKEKNKNKYPSLSRLEKINKKFDLLNSELDLEASQEKVQKKILKVLTDPFVENNKFYKTETNMFGRSQFSQQSCYNESNP